MKILGLSGSLRTDSSNRRLLQAAVALSPASVTLEIVRSLGELPHFNPDISIESSEVLGRFIDDVRQCDGMVISSPVYAGGYPGTLKNALDWLVGTDAFVEKPFMMLSASDRVPSVQVSLVTVMQTMSGLHVEDASVVVPLLGTDLTTNDIISDDDSSSAIRASMGRFAQQLS